MRSYIFAEKQTCYVQQTRYLKKIYADYLAYRPEDATQQDDHRHYLRKEGHASGQL